MKQDILYKIPICLLLVGLITLLIGIIPGCNVLLPIGGIIMMTGIITATIIVLILALVGKL